MALDVLGYIYAATVAAGGVMGYVKAGEYGMENGSSKDRAVSRISLSHAYRHLTRVNSVTGRWLGFWCYPGRRSSFQFAEPSEAITTVWNVLSIGWDHGLALVKVWQDDASGSYLRAFLRCSYQKCFRLQ